MPVLRWLFFATLSLILLLQLRGFDETLRTADTPRGMTGYRLSWTAQQASRSLTAWRDNDVLESAKVSLGVHFAFLLAYPLMFASGVALLRRPSNGARFDALGAIVRQVMRLSMPVGIVENVALWRMIDHGASALLAPLASLFTTLRFLSVVAATLWCFAALVRSFIRSRGTQSS